MRKSTVLETTFAQYKVISSLGEGGAGQVYLVQDDEGTKYAIKILNSKTATKINRKRFHNEIQFCLRSKHPHALTVLDHGLYLQPGENVPSPFYVMLPYQGSLRKLMDAKLPPDRILHYFSQLLDGVEAAHLKGATHRDLKPENVLYDAPNDSLVVADFGIAHFAEDELFTLVETRPNDRLANFQYSAPEQRQRGRIAGTAADIFALGLILNEMFTGEIPQGSEHKTISSVAPEYSYLDSLITSMMRQDPAARPTSIEEIKKELIGRRLEFVALQQLDAARQQVIQVTELDDPLINDPPRLVGFDYDGNTLTLKLSRAVHQDWFQAFRSIDYREAVWGYAPDQFSFKADRVTVVAKQDILQRIIDNFKMWLPIAAQQYQTMVQQEKEETDRKARERLRAEVEKRDQIARVMQNIKI